MARAVDVAKYILSKTGEMTAMKLQKLVYYSQAWSLVWDESPLFEDDIQAWANGPVVQVLYDYHKGQFKVNEDTFFDGDVDALTPNQKDSVEKVLEVLQNKSGQWLSELTHMESPWKEARGNLKPTERCSEVIPLAAMHEYYSSL
ncbi:Panacea domain-containing protein [Prochlorothrix hollandica]|uniref:Prophage ps3 protein 01 n=1 Tax=Prochlorothrix hollandica PCC 9006 = CALU 1027 TaxID=317619 RepID=A0A0M2PZG6_PROHO|nr:type II toxin-antitoxin system antitoxin SocA domain-containing protein [Prochlorothrix hollandica]KKJ00099.1 prophage ps3 protein 01 [Prochlorothrix hollandica PCC 9006 = CALU 1027]